jgi:hypothetical protein
MAFPPWLFQDVGMKMGAPCLHEPSTVYQKRLDLFKNNFELEIFGLTGFPKLLIKKS